MVDTQALKIRVDKLELDNFKILNSVLLLQLYITKRIDLSELNNLYTMINSVDLENKYVAEKAIENLLNNVI